MKSEERSIYDKSFPSPSEEIIGIIHGIKNDDSSYEIGLEAIKIWMIKHLSEEELLKIKERDPLFGFDFDINKENSEIKEKGMKFFVEWATRIKNGVFLKPLKGMNYNPRKERKNK